MSPTLALIGALDTKAEDYAFLKSAVEAGGCAALLIDFSVAAEPGLKPDIAASEVAEAGGNSLATLRAAGDRGAAMLAMAEGAAVLTRRLFDDGLIHGVIGMGGSGATTVATAAMRALPFGVPKVMVSTLASGDVGRFVGTSDITMIHSVVDISGINRLSRILYTRAAGAACGMALTRIPPGGDKPLIAATMFGNTTRAVTRAKALLEPAGFEVLVFHATGTGGRTMESLIESGLITGVLDMTTTEWADELCDGVLSAGPTRLEAASRLGVPQIVVPGCLDMCNFWGRDTVPERYADRTFFQWADNVTLMRTTAVETAQLGEIFAEKLNAATGPVEVYIPLRGWSEIDVQGKPFYLPGAIAAFSQALKAHLRSDIPVHELDTDINDPGFADATARALLTLQEAVPHGDSTL
ncbi:MAG: Tm-1-like ATP-binding domain-containing protein [Anaerolineae bacterium]